MTVLDELHADLDLFRELRYGGTPSSTGPTIRVLLSSRGFFAMAGHRITRRYLEWQPSTRAGRALSVVAAAGVELLSYASAVVAKGQIADYCAVEPGVYFSDLGNIMLGASKVGRGTVIHHDVTIGARAGDHVAGMPSIGRDVWIGPGCVLYGPIRVGDGVTILPGTVVSKDVPDRHVVQGYPARVVCRDFDNAALRRTLATEVRLPTGTG